MRLTKTALLLSFLFCAGKLQAFTVPEDVSGAYADQSLDSVGVEVYTTTMSNIPYVIRGASIALYGAITSTAPIAVATITYFIEFRATNTANSSSELLVPAVPISSTTRNTFVRWWPPVVASDGLCIRVTTLNATVSVFYRHLATSTELAFEIPQERHSGRRVHNAEFWGVQAGTENITGDGADDNNGLETLDSKTGEMVVTSTGAGNFGLVFGWHASTGTAEGDYFVLRDTATQPGESLHMIVPVHFNTLNEAKTLGGSSFNPPFYFPWPVRYRVSLSFQSSALGYRFRLFTKPIRSLR